MANRRTLDEIISNSLNTEFYSKERKEEVIELIMNNNLQDLLNNSEESEVLNFFHFMNISPDDEQIMLYFEKNFPTLIKMEGIDIFISNELMKEEVSTFQDAKDYVSNNINGAKNNFDRSFLLRYHLLISDIKKHALSRVKSGSLRLSMAKEDSLFRHTDEYKEKIVDEINMCKLTRMKYLKLKLKKRFGF